MLRLWSGQTTAHMFSLQGGGGVVHEDSKTARCAMQAGAETKVFELLHCATEAGAWLNVSLPLGHAGGRARGPAWVTALSLASGRTTERMLASSML